jgi:hypothetical protein
VSAVEDVMNREELTQTVRKTLGLEGGMGYDLNFDVTEPTGALRALVAYAGFARTSPPSDRGDVVVVDSTEAGEVIVGCSRARAIELVRRDCDGHVDGEHLREILRKHEVRHDAATCLRLGCPPDQHRHRGYDLLGCFTVTPDGKQDLDDLAALFVDGCSGSTFFDYSNAPGLAIDMNPMCRDNYRYTPDDPRPWKNVNGEMMGYGRKIGHAWKRGVFADLRGRIPGAETHALVACLSLRKDYKRGPVWA